ncbi:MAG: hypothetical protein GC161_10960 [Planctomycetaceae bacterium]|nr:hypothetical protein [Planctomycetaceae bacterium]
MRTLAALSLLALVTAGCQSHRYTENIYPSGTPTVADELFVLVPEGSRKSIIEARTERLRMQDAVAVAERDLKLERQRLEVAKVEAEQTATGMTAARRSLEVAEKSAEGRREADMDEAAAQIDRARARWHEARMNVAFHESRIAQLEDELELAKLRVDLADARVELDKAKAVAKLDRPEAENIAIGDFEANVEEHETRIAIAEIDAKAWEEKMELRREAIEASAARFEDVRSNTKD